MFNPSTKRECPYDCITRIFRTLQSGLRGHVCRIMWPGSEITVFYNSNPLLPIWRKLCTIVALEIQCHNQPSCGRPLREIWHFYSRLITSWRHLCHVTWQANRDQKQPHMWNFWPSFACSLYNFLMTIWTFTCENFHCIAMLCFGENYFNKFFSEFARVMSHKLAGHLPRIITIQYSVLSLHCVRINALHSYDSL